MSVAFDENNTSKRSLPAPAAEILESINQHRLLSTEQIGALHMPHASARWTQKVLRDLADAGLVAFVHTSYSKAPLRLWYLSAAGHEVVEQVPQLERRRIKVSYAGAAGQLQAHTLAVNDVGVAFVSAARERGDDCGPLAWRHEIAHACGKRGRVIADALLRYDAYDDDKRRTMTRFIEVDRATMPAEDLALKLRRYARLHGHVPEIPERAWQAHYRSFPPVLLIFAGRRICTRATLQRRMRTVFEIIHSDPLIRAVDELQIYAGLLEDLVDEGPFSPIFLRHNDPSHYVSWLGD